MMRPGIFMNGKNQIGHGFSGWTRMKEPFDPIRAIRVIRGSARRGFTLIELLVLIGIVVILAGLLLPAVARMRKEANINIAKQEFQMISNALEQYRTDFRDYPRNGYAYGDPQPALVSNATGINVFPSRTDGTLAMALLGPGPMAAFDATNTVTYFVTVNGSSQTPGDEDGADGPGFRTHLTPVATATLGTGATINSTTISLSGSVPAISGGQAGAPPPYCVISFGGSGSYPGTMVPIKQANGTSITLVAPPQYPYPAGTSVGVLEPSGKPWSAYLPAEKFKVVYQQTQWEATNLYPPMPQIADPWGQPILYFPAYAPYKNYTVGAGGDPVVAGTNNLAAIQVGRLLGLPNAPQLATQNYADVTGLTQANTVPQSGQYVGGAIFWSGAIQGFTPGQIQAMLYKLGDHHDVPGSTVGKYSNAIVTSPSLAGLPAGSQAETLSVSQPYFLLSSGPDGVFSDLNNGPVQTKTDIPTFMTRYNDDIYSFDQ
jgi:type II secretory pathway pseudopilin PulG